MYMMYLDLAELPDLFRRHWLYSAERFAPAWFRRQDHAGDPAESLDVTLRNMVEQQSGFRPDGPIRLLTHLRYFGYIFNPVSFYFCFNPEDTEVDTIVAEVTNTPWKERHYDILTPDMNEGSAGKKRYRYKKNFHVSPFMDMDHDYDWRFTQPDDRLAVHMASYRRGDKYFDATMFLERCEITGLALTRVLLRYPIMTAQVIAGIYWNALRLWMKGIPFYTHPAKREIAIREGSK
jgi:DUF1365 family protein